MNRLLTDIVQNPFVIEPGTVQQGEKRVRASSSGALVVSPWSPLHTRPTSPRLVAQEDELVGRLRQGKYADVAAYGIEVPPGQAHFRDQGAMEVDGQVLNAGAYLVATGAEPVGGQRRSRRRS